MKGPNVAASYPLHVAELAIEDEDLTNESGRRYSGKTIVRMPKTLHAELAGVAREHKISLNRLIVYLLAWGVGKAAVPPERHMRLARMFRDLKRMRHWISD